MIPASVRAMIGCMTLLMLGGILYTMTENRPIKTGATVLGLIGGWGMIAVIVSEGVAFAVLGHGW